MIHWNDFTEGDHRTACPACGRGKRDKTLGITIKYDKGVAHCFRCSYVETYRDDRGEVRRAPVLTKPAAVSHETLSDYGKALWAACVTLPGTIGERSRVDRCRHRATGTRSPRPDRVC